LCSIFIGLRVIIKHEEGTFITGCCDTGTLSILF